MKTEGCIACGKTPLSRNELGINKKLLGSRVKRFYCLECLAEFLCVDVQSILDKIEEFKDAGCTLFD